MHNNRWEPRSRNTVAMFLSRIWLLSPRRQGSFSAEFLGFARLLPVIHYRRKNAQVVTGLQTSCQESVPKLSASCVRTACSHVVATSLEQAANICNKLDGIIRLGARLFQQVCYSLDITRMLQGWRPNVVTILVYHDCIRLVGATLQQVWQY